jgi:hypothetical protein
MADQTIHLLPGDTLRVVGGDVVLYLSLGKDMDGEEAILLVPSPGCIQVHYDHETDNEYFGRFATEEEVRDAEGGQNG